VNYLSSNGSQLLKEMRAPGRELVSVRLHNLLRFTNRKAQNDSRYAGWS
jgi:hypothetical protein